MRKVNIKSSHLQIIIGVQLMIYIVLQVTSFMDGYCCLQRGPKYLSETM